MLTLALKPLEVSNVLADYGLLLVVDSGSCHRVEAAVRILGATRVSASENPLPARVLHKLGLRIHGPATLPLNP